MARRPAVLVLLLVIAGMVANSGMPGRVWIWAGISVALIAVGVLFLRRNWVAGIAAACGVFLAGAAIARLNQRFIAPDNIALFTTGGSELTTLRLRLAGWPQLSGGTAEQRTLPYKQLVLADVVGIETKAGWQPCEGRVSVSLNPPVEGLEPGETIEAMAFIERPKPAANPGEFDYAAYDRRRGILAEARVRRSDTLKIIAPASGPVASVRRWSRRALAAGFEAKSFDLAFLRMLLLGDADPRLKDVREDFTVTGASYLLSVSGLHIAILAGALLWMLRLAGVHPAKAVAVGLAFVVVYAAAVNSTQTGVRALVMCALVAVGWLGRRSVDALQVWAVAVAGILIAAPADLYDAGFQIGALAVLGLIVFMPHVTRLSRRLKDGDDPWQGRKPAGVIASIAGKIWQTILVSTVIWLMVLPIVAVYFQQINPWGALAGVVMLPVMCVALLGAAMKIVLTLAIWPLAGWWAACAAAPVHGLGGGVALLSKLPGAAVTTAAPGGWIIAAYYALLLLPLVPWPTGQARWLLRLAPAAACLLVYLAPPSAAAAPAGEDGVHVELLAIGAGQTALVRVPGGQTFFVDCGSDSVPDVYRRVIHPYLMFEGINSVDEILLSHGDYDHISAAWEIVHDYRVPTLRMTPHFREHAQGGPESASHSLLNHLDTLGPSPTLTSEGQTIDVGGGATLQILWPPVKCAMNSNDCGMVVKLNYGGHSILFPADIQVAPEEALLAHREELASDVLVAPHHGSAESSTLAFVRAVNPKVILCSSSRPLTHKQETFDELAKSWPVYRTDPCGEIELTLGRDGHIEVRGYRETVTEGQLR